ncbi:MAG: hypothetical protein ACT4OK_18045 [Gemmobacter sp.]
MTISNQKAFDSILSMAQNMLRLSAERAQSAVTPEMIEKELNKLAIMMEDDFALVDRDALVDELIRRSSRSVGDNATLSSGEDHVAWLDAERKKGWTYWQRYSEYMEVRIPWTALDALDVATDEVLSQLEDPTREGAWDRRGLVVGHVQSGKTGNYTGLICKAADAGYKIIIVLAGLHNNLRAQTQIRLDEGFLGFATIADTDELPAVGVGLIDKDVSVRPNAATNRSEKGDFNTAVAAKMNISPEQRPWLFVVKKNKTVLERLLHWIRNRVANHIDPETGRKLVTNLPLLVIDDESDHGSVDTGEDVVDENGNPDLEHQPKTINRLIRSILHHFSRKAYVGYTATPFANIFIHVVGIRVGYGGGSAGPFQSWGELHVGGIAIPPPSPGVSHSGDPVGAAARPTQTPASRYAPRLFDSMSSGQSVLDLKTSAILRLRDPACESTALPLCHGSPR